MKLFSLIITILFIHSVQASPWADVDQMIRKGVSQALIPGAVLSVGNADKILIQDAYGKGPVGGPHSENTIYDLASLTKVVGTTSSMMVLIEKGQVHLNDKLNHYFPEFTGGLKDTVTIEDVMRHKSGLPADISVRSNDTYEGFIKRVIGVPLSYVPRTSFIYSDLGFILLAEIVKKVSGKTLEEFAMEHVFVPLKMSSTFYHVPEQFKKFCAPTNNTNCRVHDPIAAKFYPEQLGHAGIFSTAHDLARLAQMYLNNGHLDGVQVYHEETVKLMTVLPKDEIRGLGWDLMSGYANAPRGDIFPVGISFGHTGYTGTSIWIDPKSKTFLVFLTNRVHSGDSASSRSKFGGLRYDLATAVAQRFYPDKHLYSKKERRLKFDDGMTGGKVKVSTEASSGQ
jgi:CubicO group peptidase (beta-lactamase class C family)